MKLGIKGTAYVVLVCAAIACVSHTRAADTTNYLGSLREEISFRATNSPATNKTQKAQLAALKAAGNKLQKPAKTYSGQLGQLATAVTILNTRFTNDTQLETVENDTLDAYFALAAAQLADADARIGTNHIQRGLSNQLVKAVAAYTNAVNNTNGIPSQARALAQAFNKMRIPVMQITKKFPGGGGEEPPGTAESPSDITPPQVIVLSETAPTSSQTKFWFHTINTDNRVPYKHYSSDNPAELGTWTYRKTGNTTGAIDCTVTLSEVEGGSTAPHTMSLTFTSATGGTFTGRNTLNEDLTGTFIIATE